MDEIENGPPTEGIPAATLVLFRDRDGNVPELLMVERSSKMAFAAGAVVFPGGRVDDDDRMIATRFPDVEPDCAAARIAAIRETIEESGVPIALMGDVPTGWLGEARKALHDRQPFSALIDAAGLSLDLGALVPFARWWPRFRETRVFDTRFYIARAPDDIPDAVVDATENVRTFWSAAQETIDSAGRGEAHIIYPTHRNLERLALFANFDDARIHADATRVGIVTPFMEEIDGERFLCIPNDLGYPITRQSMATAKRAGD